MSPEYALDHEWGDWLVATAQQLSCRVTVPPALSKELGHMYTGIFKVGLMAAPQELCQQV